jgi:hypothetical protein
MTNTALIEKEKELDFQLLLSKGIVFLRAPGLPALACTLANLSDQGCQCAGTLNDLNRRLAEDWRKLLHTGYKFLADILAPPHLRRVHVQAEIQDVAFIGEKACLDLRFAVADTAERILLDKALLVLSQGKPEATGQGTAAPTLPQRAAPPMAPVHAAPAQLPARRKKGSTTPNASAKPCWPRVRAARSWRRKPITLRAKRPNASGNIWCGAAAARRRTFAKGWPRIAGCR